MSKGGAPSKRKDVLIKAPPAIWPVKKAASDEMSDQELIKLQAARIAQLEQELTLQKTSAETIATFAICMIHIFNEMSGKKEVMIPADLYHRMVGAEIQLCQPPELNGAVLGRFNEPYDGNVVLPIGAIR
jgi:hypothetical protein